MNFVRLLPVFLCAVLLGAHFFRQGALELAAIPVALPFVLLVRRPWAARLVQIALVLAALEWVRTLWALIQIRQAHGAPWARMGVILGVVALINLASTLVFRSKALKRRYSLGTQDQKERDVS